jgi:uncharacterized protein (DUF1499 family)
MIAAPRSLLRVAALNVALIALFTLSGANMGLFSGTRPDNLGVHDGLLAPPKPTPNNVSSQADKNSDAGHFIEPLRYGGEANKAWEALQGSVSGMQRVKMVKSESNYLYAEFSSRLMGYVDDVEFHLDRALGVIHVRSASRLGRSDFGVNRERIEAIRARLVEQMGGKNDVATSKEQ